MDKGSTDPSSFDTFGFFFTAPATHHLYYLLPFIRATKHKTVWVFAPSDNYLALLRRTYPGINFKPAYRTGLAEFIQRLKKYDGLIFANGYSWFVKDVQPHLQDETLLIRASHGSSHKYANDAGYYAANVYAWDGVIVLGRKDVDLFYDFFQFPKGSRQYGQVLKVERPQNTPFMLIQSGNLRVQRFFDRRPARESIINAFPSLDFSKKTVLVMPTHPLGSRLGEDGYSGLSFFLDCLDGAANTSGYNFVFKLHPNIAEFPTLFEALKETCRRKGIALDYGLLVADYLPIMSVSDILIADRTSAVFDFFYFEKPVIFLDHLDEYDGKVAEDDLRHPYWSYRFGPVISRKNQTSFVQVLEGELGEDHYFEDRQKCMGWAFPTVSTPENVMTALLHHPKLEKKRHA